MGDSIVDIRAKLNPNVVPMWHRSVAVSVTRAGSDALAAARAEAVREVRRKREIKVSAIRKAITSRGPKVTEDGTSVSWFIRVSRLPLRVSDYPVRQVSAGVKAQIKAGSWSLIPHAFIATVGTGQHEGVFLRHGPYRVPTKGRWKGTKRKRQAIKELYTTTVLDVFKNKDFLDVVGAKARAVFKAAFDRNMREFNRPVANRTIRPA